MRYINSIGQHNHGGFDRRDYGMFSKIGNAAVQQIVDKARSLAKDYGCEQAWNYALAELERLGSLEGCEEATDTAVREAVYDAVV